jgi:hypothetical protein
MVIIIVKYCLHNVRHCDVLFLWMMIVDDGKCIMTTWIDVNICKLQWVHRIVGKLLA